MSCRRAHAATSTCASHDRGHMRTLLAQCLERMTVSLWCHYSSTDGGVGGVRAGEGGGGHSCDRGWEGAMQGGEEMVERTECAECSPHSTSIPSISVKCRVLGPRRGWGSSGHLHTRRCQIERERARERERGEPCTNHHYSIALRTGATAYRTRPHQAGPCTLQTRPTGMPNQSQLKGLERGARILGCTRVYSLRTWFLKMRSN